MRIAYIFLNKIIKAYKFYKIYELQQILSIFLQELNTVRFKIEKNAIDNFLR